MLLVLILPNQAHHLSSPIRKIRVDENDSKALSLTIFEAQRHIPD